MEFNEKLQELRKQKGLTQEELAEKLFVSRTAVSKWESGRGYPNIDSLKAMAKFFGVTVDELLSGDEVLTIAEEESRKSKGNLRDSVCGLLDISVALFFFLPLFGQKTGNEIIGVSLLNLTEISAYIKVLYFAVTSAMIFWGIATLALQNCEVGLWLSVKNKLSVFLSAIGVLVFILSPQPYAAALLFVFLAIKASVFIKKK